MMTGSITGLHFYSLFSVLFFIFSGCHSLLGLHDKYTWRGLGKVKAWVKTIVFLHKLTVTAIFNDQYLNVLSATEYLWP